MNGTHRLRSSDVYIISYDIGNNKFRRKIEKALKNYGVRIQYSVFRCNLDSVKLQAAIGAIRSIAEKCKNMGLSSDDDSVIVVGANAKNMDYVLGNDDSAVRINLREESFCLVF
jgi:CRISPR-associated endonuclease Cas2